MLGTLATRRYRVGQAPKVIAALQLTREELQEQKWALDPKKGEFHREEEPTADPQAPPESQPGSVRSADQTTD